MDNNISVDQYPEALSEIIKYMDYMPEDDSARMELLMAFCQFFLQQ